MLAPMDSVSLANRCESRIRCELRSSESCPDRSCCRWSSAMSPSAVVRSPNSSFRAPACSTLASCFLDDWIDCRYCRRLAERGARDEEGMFWISTESWSSWVSTEPVATAEGLSGPKKWVHMSHVTSWIT